MMNSLFDSFSMDVSMSKKVIPKIVVSEPSESEEDEPENSNTFKEYRPRIEIVKFPKERNNFVCCWTWDVSVENCAICRNNINNICIECQGNDFSKVENKRSGIKSGATCTISEGSCKHVFHTHCITRWIQHRSVCPLCGCNWMSLLPSS